MKSDLGKKTLISTKERRHEKGIIFSDIFSDIGAVSDNGPAMDN
jgi:hypothetical protein